MPASPKTGIAPIVAAQEQQILGDWLKLLKATGTLDTGRIKESELATQAGTFIGLLRDALSESGLNVNDPGYARVRDFLTDVSHSRAIQGFSTTETATFIFSLKKPLFDAVKRGQDSVGDITQATWDLTVVLDALGLHTVNAFQKSREAVIVRQQQEISELSTPVVKLWDGILALPLIGTLDSSRTQVVMENLLQSIVDHGAELAIIDITGVPTVDTLVAQHLLKTVAAARLMGADCIVSGIRPQIAQTMVHLGVDLDVVTKSSLADAFAIALRRTGRTVVRDNDPRAVRSQ